VPITLEQTLELQRDVTEMLTRLRAEMSSFHRELRQGMDELHGKLDRLENIFTDCGD